MRKTDDTDDLFWFEGMTPEQMHLHVYVLQGHFVPERSSTGMAKALSPFWGIGKRWVEEARERWGGLDDVELRRRAEILKKVARIERSATMDERVKGGKIGGLMASANRTPAEASERVRAAQRGRWLRKARADFPDDTPEEQARKASVLKRMQGARLQMGSLKARHSKKRGKTAEDTKRLKSQITKLNRRLAGLAVSLRGDGKTGTA